MYLFVCGKDGERSAQVLRGVGVTLKKEMGEILWMEEEGSGFGKEQLRSFCC